MRQRVAVAAAAIGAVLLALGAFSARSDPAAELVSAFRADAGVTFMECTDDPCLTAAEAQCTPAHLAKTLQTIEGTEVEIERFLLRTADGCRAIEFADYTRDAWGGCVVRRQTCPTLNALGSGDRIHQGCSESEILFTEERCTPGP